MHIKLAYAAQVVIGGSNYGSSSTQSAVSHENSSISRDSIHSQSPTSESHYRHGSSNGNSVSKILCRSIWKLLKFTKHKHEWKNKQII